MKRRSVDHGEGRLGLGGSLAVGLVFLYYGYLVGVALSQPDDSLKKARGDVRSRADVTLRVHGDPRLRSKRPAGSD